MSSSVLFSVEVRGRVLDVVSMQDEGEEHLDLFEQSTGECLNLGEPIFEMLDREFSNWPTHLQAMVEDFFAENPEV